MGQHSTARRSTARRSILPVAANQAAAYGGWCHLAHPSTQCECDFCVAFANLLQAWEKPLVNGGSSAPLRHSCLLATTSSSSNGNGFSRSPTAGGSPEACKRSAAALQLQLLLVQPDGWRLFVCSSFGSSDGMPCQWMQLAQQLQAGPNDTRMYTHSTGMGGGSRRHGAAHSGLAVGAAPLPGASAHVRFELGDTGVPAAAEACTRPSSDGTSSSSSSSSSSDSGSESADEGQDAGAESEGSVGHKGSRLQKVAGPTGRQHRAQGVQLLGGTLVQLPAATAAGSDVVGSWQQQQQQMQPAGAEVLVWSSCGEQQLWSVPLQPASSSYSSRPEQQQQQQVLVQQLQLQPWPAHAVARVFPAVNSLHTGVSLLVQHSRHTHHHHHHHRQQLQQQHDGHQGHSSADAAAEWLLFNVPHKWRSDWHLHCMQLQAQGPQQVEHSSSSSPAQQLQLPLQLQHCQGSLGAAWCLHSSAHDDSSSSQHIGSTRVRSRQQAADSSCSAVGTDAMQVDTDGAVTGSSSRKRPAAEEPATEAATEAAEGPGTGRAKQPRMQATAGAGGPHRVQLQEAAAGQQSAAAWLDGQQQQVSVCVCVCVKNSGTCLLKAVAVERCPSPAFVGLNPCTD